MAPLDAFAPRHAHAQSRHRGEPATPHEVHAAWVDFCLVWEALVGDAVPRWWRWRLP
jgi:hypothetical protein